MDPLLYTVSEEDKYYFDLRGYLVVENAISETEVKECNDAIDHYEDEIKTRENLIPPEVRHPRPSMLLARALFRFASHQSPASDQPRADPRGV